MPPANVAINLCNIVIWTGVEVHMSLVCGQYTKHHLLFTDHLWTDRQKHTRANISAPFLLLACLPSLRPIATFVSDKFKQLRKHKNTLKSGNAVTFLPLSRNTIWDDGHHSILDSPSVKEMKPVASHVEAKAPGHWESEVDTFESAL